MSNGGEKREISEKRSARNGVARVKTEYPDGEKSEISEKRSATLVVLPAVQNTPPPPTHLLITATAQLPMVLAAVENSVRVGLDLETCGPPGQGMDGALDPRRGRIRLLSLTTDTLEDGGSFTYLVDCDACHPRPLFEVLAGVELVIHNASFDLGFLTRMGFVPDKVTDTLLLSRLLDGTRQPRNYHTLAACVQRHLGQELPKDLQRSDWSGTLTAEQLGYAARDAEVLRPLADALGQKVKDVELRRVADIEMRCLPAVVWLSGAGVAIDADAWRALAVQADAEAEALAADLDRLAPKPDQPNLMGGGWNWDSPEQVKKVFAALGVELEKTDDAALAGCTHPLAAVVRRHRSASKRRSTYGKEWLKHVAADGRVYAEWRQTGTLTGRMSCGSPNLQQLPNDPRYRRCFTAPPGRVLVKADYSQVELRIACKIAGEQVMLDAYRKGLDLHTLTARRILGKNDISKEERRVAKAVNFGLIYGMGVKTFRANARSEYGVELTQEQAAEYRRAFFEAYPGLNAWHRRTGREHERTVLQTRTLAGRLIHLTEKTRYTDRLNYPVQGTGADGIKLALSWLWERRGEVPGAFPVLVVHDELVVECDAGQAEAVSPWLKQAMLDAMTPLLDPVPVEVEVSVGRTWGGN
jgi:DNA polymerase-1